LYVFAFFFVIVFLASLFKELVEEFSRLISILDERIPASPETLISMYVSYTLVTTLPSKRETTAVG
jgi:predicted KAP-like P-loop ATPase